MVVVDASVVYKWIVDERDEATKSAVSLRNQLLTKDIDVVSSDLLFYEIANTLAYKAHLSISDVKKAWRNFILLNIPTTPVTKTIASQCLELSQKFHISVYDASYIVLAKTKRCDMITADKKLINRVRLPFVRNILDYQS